MTASKCAPETNPAQDGSVESGESVQQTVSADPHPSVFRRICHAARRRRGLCWAMGIMVAVVLGWWVVPSTGGSRPLETFPAEALETAHVKRGAMKVTVESEGVLESASSELLISQVEWKTKIITLVPAGTPVERGDVVCELDTSRLETKLEQRRIYLTRAEAALARAKEEYEIQKMRNDRNVANAKMRWELADLEAKKYKDAEFEQQSAELGGARTLAEQELSRSKSNYEYTQRLSRKGYSSQTEVENARIGLFKSEIEVQVAGDKQRLHDEYTGVSRRSQLEATALQRKGEYERVNSRAELALLQREVSVKANQRSVMAHRRQFDRIQRNIEACTMRAPRAGDVVYAKSRRSSVRKEDRIQPGVDVRYRQALIELPDMSKMRVATRVHESQIGFLTEGLPVAIRLDAVPNEVFYGSLSYISRLPVNGEWPHTELRFYEAVVEIPDEITKEQVLKPGLNAKLEIEVERYDGVLQVPSEAVVTLGEQHRVYVVTDAGLEPRQVLIDRSNDASVEVLDGLSEGESVVLNPEAISLDESESDETLSGSVHAT